MTNLEFSERPDAIPKERYFPTSSFVTSEYSLILKASLIEARKVFLKSRILLETLLFLSPSAMPSATLSPNEEAELLLCRP